MTQFTKKRLHIFVLLLTVANITVAKDYQLLAAEPHPRTTFTQGLEYHQGRLYESSGLYGQSYIHYRNADGSSRRRKLDSELFAEGLTVLNNNLYMLTWKAGRCLVLDPETLETRGEQRYRGEGWGLTNNGRQLIMSNGSSYLSFIDPEKWQLQRQLQVHYRGKPVAWINEMEWHNGLILANQWQRDHLLVIDEHTGQVLKVIDLRDLYPANERPPKADVMNGIAYDAATESWLITGKRWPKAFRLSLSLPAQAPLSPPLQVEPSHPHAAAAPPESPDH